MWCTDSPGSRSNITVVIRVPRNPNAPEIVGLPATVTIYKTFRPALPFFNISAYDLDGDDVFFEISGAASDSIRRRFFIYPQTGVIILRMSIENDFENRYVVSTCLDD